MLISQLLQFVGILIAGGIVAAIGFFVGRKGAWDAMKDNADAWRQSAQIAKEREAEFKSKEAELNGRVTRLEVLYEQEQLKRLKAEKLHELLELDLHYFDMVLHILARNEKRLPADVADELKLVLSQKDQARKEAKGLFLEWEISTIISQRTGPVPAAS